MFYIETFRLILVSTPLEVIRTRLEREAFTAEVTLAGGPEAVTFPAEWPGDALALFPCLVEQLEANPKQELWEGTLIERTTYTAIGQLGCKGMPDENGSVEIGYGLSPAFRGRGYATEIVGALTSWLLKQPTVSKVTAECLKTNVPSVRVLQKTGFNLVGEKASDEGHLSLWECEA